MSGQKLVLHVGDYVRLTGYDWAGHNGVGIGDIVRVDKVDDYGRAYSNGPAGSLTNNDGEMYQTYAVELVPNPVDTRGNPLGRKFPTDAQMEAFKEAWRAADRLGLEGQRTRAGLIAVLNLQEDA